MQLRLTRNSKNGLIFMPVIPRAACPRTASLETFLGLRSLAARRIKGILISSFPGAGPKRA